jgi:hypothetical protein
MREGKGYVKRMVKPLRLRDKADGQDLRDKFGLQE